MNVSIATAPPTIESARSALNPSISSRLFSSLLARRRQVTDDAVKILEREHVSVELADGITKPAAIDLGQVAKRAARPHQTISTAEMAEMAEMAEAGALQMLPDMLSQATKLPRPGRIELQERLAQAESEPLPPRRGGASWLRERP